MSTIAGCSPIGGESRKRTWGCRPANSRRNSSRSSVTCAGGKEERKHPDRGRPGVDAFLQRRRNRGLRQFEVGDFDPVLRQARAEEFGQPDEIGVGLGAAAAVGDQDGGDEFSQNDLSEGQAIMRNPTSAVLPGPGVTLVRGAGGHAPLPAGGLARREPSKALCVQAADTVLHAPLTNSAGIAERGWSSQRWSHKRDVRCLPRFLIERLRRQGALPP